MAVENRVDQGIPVGYSCRVCPCEGELNGKIRMLADFIEGCGGSVPLMRHTMESSMLRVRGNIKNQVPWTALASAWIPLEHKIHALPGRGSGNQPSALRIASKAFTSIFEIVEDVFILEMGKEQDYLKLSNYTFSGDISFQGTEKKRRLNRVNKNISEKVNLITPYFAAII
ncbi:hypothetical protein MSSAC_1787 [Methanosarcina siciliae C2J]|uniref:Uncharacterized protein n=1 Tax=Methanosarcina siciliae C2J TaxID=1434118 RepID=A0A0E3PLV7_9EURY|nr:hypothetical protein [Methanosarcina siciliae]AKB36377.1 hypothetical protein MSSAC_1787 [Methanosarcina siciliae C2J]